MRETFHHEPEMLIGPLRPEPPQQWADRRLLDSTWEYGTEAAVRMAQIGRYGERCADHAVAMARQVAFLAGRIRLTQDTPARRGSP